VLLIHAGQATRTACNLSIHSPILPSTLNTDCLACSNYTVAHGHTGSEGEIEIREKQDRTEDGIQDAINEGLAEVF